MEETIGNLSGIRVCIWDFDGTFYRPDEALFREVREAEYRTVMAHTGWDRERTLQEFHSVYKKVYPSATETTAHLAGITIAAAAIEMEEYFDRRKYLKRDERLISMFRLLSDKRHFILANGVVSKHRECLKVLGVAESIFEEIVTSETVGVTKPHPAGFEHILKTTQLPPASHLMIGDREEVDLVPARKLGLRTCLVFSEKRSTIADRTLPTVYDVPQILTDV